MIDNIKSWARVFLSRSLKTFFKSFLVIGLVAVLVFSQADGAFAARSGGRIGGGSFRAPSRSYSTPSRTRGPSSYSGGYRGGYGGGYYPGGGFGFPFLLPFVGFGGMGGLFGIFITIAIANFIIRSFREAGVGGDSAETYSSNPTVSVARLQVGLLAEARSLQTDLTRLAETADTSTSAGLTKILQETTLSLLRHPEYWVYADIDSDQTRLLSAEQAFNQLAIAERSKFTRESLSNVNAQISQAKSKAALNSSGELATAEDPGEYIVATILVASQGKLNLPKNTTSTDDVRQAINRIGSISSEQLMAVEVLWTPQVPGETLSADELIAEYPNLQLV
ncbi:conserved hypothetical protein [Synechococcus sp. PCC 7335]|uniref:DUF1517 domain-containing protein n=1 Tax=Synechococcus sp. (strain ATCC 29403 / PCC 7335) TaxID=91464 RepID=UPI00017ED553|nr:DUF1517 domain-containing protein [Synechococcus sp. PCC 7335]EDX85211.1 conserved hypothetical protein [Synechococcus sp. PCC 7335]